MANHRFNSQVAQKRGGGVVQGKSEEKAKSLPMKCPDFPGLPGPAGNLAWEQGKKTSNSGPLGNFHLPNKKGIRG